MRPAPEAPSLIERLRDTATNLTNLLASEAGEWGEALLEDGESPVDDDVELAPEEVRDLAGLLQEAAAALEAATRRGGGA